MIFILDNYDSFTYNLVQFLGELGEEIVVCRNDQVELMRVEKYQPDRIVISPGPGRPEAAGITLDLINHFAGRVPILGVCLGHQAIGQVFGGCVIRASQLVHGKASEICHDGRTIFQGLETRFKAGRYHSLIVERDSLPDCFEVSASTSDGTIMGIRHRAFKIEGVQFHPESILTEGGKKLLANFFKPMNNSAIKTHSELGDDKRCVESLTQLVRRLVNGEDLSRPQADTLLNAILDESVSDAQIAAALISLAVKGETADELSAMAEVMRSRAVRIRPTLERFIDTAGTGASPAKTFNVSTASALVIAGSGLPVAKHGGRAATSQSGSADAFAALGVNVVASPEVSLRCLNEVGLCFMFAPLYHAATARVAAIRREIGVPTTFNLLGPLTNPAGAPYQIIGVWKPSLMRPVAEALLVLGTTRAWVVHGSDGLDEVTLSGKTLVTEAFEGTIREFEIRPEDFGLDASSLTALRQKDASASASLILEILRGERRDEARDMVVINAAAALIVGGMAPGPMEAARIAEESIDNGQALAKLNQLARVTNK